MKNPRRTSPARLARQLGIPKSRGLEAVLKAQLIAATIREVRRRGLTHAVVAARSGLSRSAVTGILSGSLQKVTIDRLLRLYGGRRTRGEHQGEARSLIRRDRALWPAFN